MATPRDIRRLAFQTLFQLDARADLDAQDVLDSLENAGDFSPKDRAKAFELATGAYADRDAADKAMLELAPTWPAHRQAAVDQHRAMVIVRQERANFHTLERSSRTLGSAAQHRDERHRLSGGTISLTICARTSSSCPIQA